MKKRITVLAVLMSLVFLINVQSSTPQGISTLTKVGKGSPQFRAIAGVSMGGYGAMNIGLSHPDAFKTIACLGGPLDMAYLLKFIEVDMLGNYDNPNLYPNRDTGIKMLKDLAISFGNPVYYNPLTTYYPSGITAENARKSTTLLNFKDGEYNPDGSLPIITYEDPSPVTGWKYFWRLISMEMGKEILENPSSGSSMNLLRISMETRCMIQVNPLWMLGSMGSPALETLERETERFLSIPTISIIWPRIH